MTDSSFVVIASTFVVWLSLATIYQIIKSDMYDRFQKIIQCSLSILLPVIFPLIALGIIRSHNRAMPRRSSQSSAFFLINWLTLAAFVEGFDSKVLSDSSSGGVTVPDVGGDGGGGGGD